MKWPKSPNVHRPRNVLEILLSKILTDYRHFALNVFVDLGRDIDGARFGEGLQTRGYVDTVAVNANVIVDDIPDIDADAVLHAPRGFDFGIALGHYLLESDGAVGRVTAAAELGQDSGSSGVDHAPAILADQGQQDPLMRLEVANRARLICAHEGAVPCDVGGKNCSQPAGRPWIFANFRHLLVYRRSAGGLTRTIWCSGRGAWRGRHKALPSGECNTTSHPGPSSSSSGSTSYSPRSLSRLRSRAWLLQPLAEKIEEHVMAGTVIHADDTPVKVLAPGNGKTKTGRFWAYLRDERAHGG